MLGHLPPSELPEPNDWEVSGPHRQLTESTVKDLRIRELEEQVLALELIAHISPGSRLEAHVAGTRTEITELKNKVTLLEEQNRDLEEDNYSLRLELVIAKASRNFSPAQIQALKDLIRDANQIIEKERQRAKAA